MSLWRALDREAPEGAIAVAEIIGVDRGSPPLSATATLTITVTDVNDCAPILLPPTTLHVAEGSPPTLLGVLAATDHDVWALGHGPPFNMSLAPTNPAYVLSHVSLTFDSRELVFACVFFRCRVRVYLLVSLPVYPSTYLFIYLSIYVSILLFVYL